MSPKKPPGSSSQAAPVSRSTGRFPLERVEAQLRAIFDSALDALITIDERGSVVEFNRAAERIFGYPRDQVIGREMAEIIVPPSLRERHRQGMKHYLASGEGPILERRIEIVGMRADGSEFPVELTVTRVPLEAQVLFTGALRDITERKRSEGRREAQYSVTGILAKSASLEEAAPDLLRAICRGVGWEIGQLWVRDEAAGVLRLCASWSVRPETSEFERRSAATVFPPGTGLPGRVYQSGEPAWLEDLSSDSNFPRLAAATACGLRTGFACPIRTGERVAGILELFTSETRSDDEDLIRFIDALGRQIGDFLDRRRAERTLRESEERYRRILETTNEGIWWIDADARTVYVNEQMAGMLGKAAGELLGRPVVEFLDPADREPIIQLFARRRRGASEQFDMRFRRPDGSSVWAIVSATPILDAGGLFGGTFAMVTDITDRKRAEESDRFLLEASRLFGSSLDYELTLRRVADLAVPRIGDWCQVDMIGNDGELELLAVAHAEPEKAHVARRMRERYPPDPSAPAGLPHVARTGESELMPEIPDSLLAASAVDPEHLAMLRSLGLASYICVPMSAHGRVFGTLTFVTAESRRRYDETDLRLAERLSSLAAVAIENARLYRDAQEAVRHRDDFLSIAGHELKTPLSTLSLEIHRLVEHARASQTPDPASLRGMEKAARSVLRLSRLVDQLLDVSRVGAGRLSLEPEELDLSALCREVADRFAEELGRRDSALDLRVDPPVVGFWDRLRLDQVVGNLLSNAIKYGQGRPIELEARVEGDRAVLSVRDRGIGIPAQDQTRVFARFERAVSSRHFGGLGLGLWIVHQIVEASGGTIAVESAEGAGTTFTVRLPLRLEMEP